MVHNLRTVLKRSGRVEEYSADKLARVVLFACNNNKELADQLLEALDIKINSQMKITDLYDEVITTAVNMINPIARVWDEVAERLLLMKMYKESFNLKTTGYYPAYREVVALNIKLGHYDKSIFDSFTPSEIDQLGQLIDPDRDLKFSYKSLYVMTQKYCMKNGVALTELPQHAYLRQAIQSFYNDPDKSARLRFISDEYDVWSSHLATAATPRALNSVRKNAQLASCVLSTADDDTENILDTAKNLAAYSKFSGGLAVDVSSLRSSGARIKGNAGFSNGPVPFIKLFESVVSSFDQGSSRNGSSVITYPFWHWDVLNLIPLNDAGGAEDKRARKLKYAMRWHTLLSDRIKSDGWITLFNPQDVPLLNSTHSDEFIRAYITYETDNSIQKKRVKARELAYEFIKVRKETGNQYVTFIDNINAQSTVGDYVGASNLCFTGDTMVAVADGRNAVSIKELADQSQGVNKFLVYSTTPRKGRMSMPKRNGGVNTYHKFDHPRIKTAVAFKTGVKKVITVVLSNGDEFRCTEDHELGCSDGKWIKAKDSVGKMLMPFFSYTPAVGSKYRHINSCSDGGSKQPQWNKPRLDYINTHFYDRSSGNLIQKGLSVVRVIDNNEVEEVYDLTVDDDHNFFIITSTDDDNYDNCQGVLVHNCTEIVVSSRPSTNYSSKIITDESGKTRVITEKDSGEIGLCNLLSINLYEWFKLSIERKHAVMKSLLRGADNIIESQFYPVKEAKVSNIAKRPIGIGVSNYANLLASQGIKFTDEAAKKFTHELFEELSYIALYESNQLAKLRGPFSYFRSTKWSTGSTPVSESILAKLERPDLNHTLRYDWDALSSSIKDYGVRFSLHLAIAPTASSAITINATESTEPIHGFFSLNEGTQTLPSLVPNLENRKFYQLNFEVPARTIIELAAIRQKFLDQAQSINLYYPNPDRAKVLVMDVIYAQELGLKSLYYMKTQKSGDQYVCESCS